MSIEFRPVNDVSMNLEKIVRSGDIIITDTSKYFISKIGSKINVVDLENPGIGYIVDDKQHISIRELIERLLDSNENIGAIRYVSKDNAHIVIEAKMSDIKLIRL